MSDIASKTYYELLGLERTATKEQIRDAYREIARIYHPDSNFFNEIIHETLSPEQQSTFKAITAAYNTLTNDTKRAEYDQLLPKDLPGWEPTERWSEAYHMPKETTQTAKISNPAFGRFGVVSNPAEKTPKPQAAAVVPPVVATANESWLSRLLKRV